MIFLFFMIVEYDFFGMKMSINVIIWVLRENI